MTLRYLYGMEYPFVRIGFVVSSLISSCILSVRPCKLNTTSGCCFISISTSSRCSDVTSTTSYGLLDCSYSLLLKVGSNNRTLSPTPTLRDLYHKKPFALFAPSLNFHELIYTSALIFLLTQLRTRTSPDHSHVISP